MENTILYEIWEGFDSVRISNSCVSVRLVPDLGCKVVEITDLRSDYEWLWRDLSRPYKRRKFSDRYDDHDISGFDECFPNIGISQNPEDSHSQLPDHGELWCQPWSVTINKGVIHAVAESKLFDYSFHRRIQLVDENIFFEYEIQNRSPRQLEGFWTAHPLFQAQENMHIEISGNPSMTKEFGFGGRVGHDGMDGYAGHLDVYTWPLTLGADGRISDLSVISLQNPVTDKVVLQSPSDGLVSLSNKATGQRLFIKFDPAQLPFLGICFNLGAYPKTGTQGMWLAIEPSQGATDRLDEAKKLGLKALEPGKTRTWSMSWRLSSD